ncbi:MAG: transcriptional regulator [Deltaproteobacteria bacterium]|nr:transcriptional regulator [Deltaproteobacteria bacterium]
MQHQWFKDVCTLLASANTPEEVGEILNELLTPYERDSIAERWQIVQLLLEGRSQRDVRDILHVAIATVSRGARVLKYGRGTLQKKYESFYE